MDYCSSEQVQITDIQGIHFDLFIAASGYEKRCTTCFLQNNISARKKIAFAFTEKITELHRKENDKFFLTENFEFINLSGEDPIPVFHFFHSFFDSTENDAVNILIDISCMTKTWYAAIIQFLSEYENDLTCISVYFYYTPAEFSLPRRMKPVKTAHSIVQKDKVYTSTEKPLALIINLGIEPEKAEFIINKLNPSQLILMYADPSFDKRYVEEILKRNRKIIDKIEIRNFINYPVNNVKVIYEILNNICIILRLNFNVIIVPLGPKIFTLISLLLVSRYPDIDVWRVSSGGGDPVYDRQPLPHPLVYKISFVNDEEVL